MMLLLVVAAAEGPTAMATGLLRHHLHLHASEPLFNGTVQQ